MQQPPAFQPERTSGSLGEINERAKAHFLPPENLALDLAINLHNSCATQVIQKDGVCPAPMPASRARSHLKVEKASLAA